jgi:prepilin-type N-terminal cleavage/methylation domain-containing protein
MIANLRLNPQRELQQRGSRIAPLRNSGFTLLEVLLSMVLAGALMAGLWGVLSLNLRTFEVGRVKTERAQLTRALAERIENDLRAIAPLADELKATQDRLRPSTADGFASTGDALLPGAPTPLGATTSPGASLPPTAAPANNAPGLSPPSIPPPASTPATTLGTSSPASVTPPGGPSPAGAGASLSFADSTSSAVHTPAPVYSLIGSSHALQVRVLTATAEAEALATTDAGGQLSTPLPRDLQIVEYRLEQPQLAPQSFDTQTTSSQPAWRGAGLSRRQRAWTVDVRSTDASDSNNSSDLPPSGEDPASAVGGYLGGSSTTTLGGESSPLGSSQTEFPSDRGSLDSPTSTGTGSSFPPLPPGVRSEQLFVPEVTGWQLRYFDGQQWHTQWHSGRKGLPAAIEVTLSLKAAEPSRRRPRTNSPAAAPSDAASDSQTPGDADVDVRRGEETMRLVIHLPSAWGPVSSRDASQQPGGLTDPMPTDPGGSSQLRGDSGASTVPMPGGSP